MSIIKRSNTCVPECFNNPSNFLSRPSFLCHRWDIIFSGVLGFQIRNPISKSWATSFQLMALLSFNAWVNPSIQISGNFTVANPNIIISHFRPRALCKLNFGFIDLERIGDLPCCAVARVIEQCCFNNTPDHFIGQTANIISKPPKVIESRSYVKKANLECYWNNTVQ